jgi:hypothetical protein
VHVEVVGQAGEVHLAGVGEGTGLLDLENVVEDGVEQGDGVSELGELEEEADDGGVFGYTMLGLILVECMGCIPSFWKTK